MPEMVGRFAVFNTWAEITDRQGHYLERIDPAAFKRTIEQDGERVRAIFHHGLDPALGSLVLGPITRLDTDTSFAVDLFDVDESTIAPTDGAAIVKLGGPTDTTAAAARPPARDELWIPLVMLVLAILLVEWLVYERDALARLRRGLSPRLGRAG